MAWPVALFQLVRAPRAVLVSSIVLFALYLRTANWGMSLIHALPLMLICMIGFLINNLHDIEKDRQNHPDRPLPRGAISVGAGAVAFFALLATVLTFIRLLMPHEIAFLYVLGLLGMINYNYVVSYLWPLKNAYAAAVTTLPLFVIWQLSPPAAPLAVIAVSLFLHTLGTEMLSDLRDWRGDAQTIVKWLGVRAATLTAFACKLGAGILLLACATTASAIATALAVLLVEGILAFLWVSDFHRRQLTIAMTAQVAIGACLLR